jgi:hypothetical protein
MAGIRPLRRRMIEHMTVRNKFVNGVPQALFRYYWGRSYVRNRRQELADAFRGRGSGHSMKCSAETDHLRARPGNVGSQGFVVWRHV